MPTSRSTILPNRRWRGTRAVVSLALVAAGLTVAAPAAHAASFTVTKTSDTNDGTCDADCSLREAIVAANAAGGADTISVPAGTYQLTLAGEDDGALLGDLDVTDALTITGAGAASTIIDGRDLDRVFDIAPVNVCACVISISGVTVTNGNGNLNNFNVGGAIYIGPGPDVRVTDSVISSSASVNGTGGGIEARGNSLSLANVVMRDNDALAGGGALRSIGSLTITGSTFTNNEAEYGGAIALVQDLTKTISISGSRFIGNRATATAGGAADDGGAIHADIDTVLTLTGNTLTGNTAANNGGAISFADNPSAGTGSLNAGFNRIVGNTAVVAGSGLNRISGTVSAENNWWGCNAGPTVAPCDRVQGAADTDPWLVLTHTASPTSISAGGTSTLTASFLTNSAAVAIPAANLGAMVGTPVTFDNAVLGSISGAQATIQSSGTATATYTAGGTGGAGSADATVDAQTVSASITIVRESTTVSSLDADDATPTNAASVSWTATFADAVSGLSAGNFSLANSGLGGTPQITAVTPSGSAPATTWTVTASTGTGAGTLGLNLVNDTGISHALSNLPFTGDVYTVDRDAPDTSITTNPANPSSSASASFTFSGTDTGTGVASFACQIDGAGFSACTSPKSYTSLADGSHTFQVRAIDGVGNVDATPASFTWTIDTAGPDTTIDSQPANPSNSSSASFTFSGTDSGTGVASFECKLDGGGFAACTSPQSYTGLADGSHTFQVRAVDGGGLVDATPASYTWTIDTIAPRVTINQASGQTDPTGASPVNFTVTFDEPVTGFTSADVSIGGTAGATTAVVTGGPSVYNVALSGMSTNGTVTATVPAGSAFDAASNSNLASTSTDNTVTFVADSTPPDTSITSTPSNPSNSTSASFTFAGSDDQTPAGSLTFECDLDGGGFAVCTSPQSYTGLGAGSHTFRVRSIDAVGNVDATPASFTWTIDTTPPAVAINQAAAQADPTSASPINFTAVFSEPVTGFSGTDVTLTGTAGATTATVTGGPTTYNVAVSGMTADGTVIASIIANGALDAAGNGNTASTSTDPTVTFNFNVAPAATVSNGQCSAANLVSGTLNLTLSDADNDALTLTLASNSNPTLVPASGIVLGGSGDNRTLRITAAAKRSGTATITLNLRDGTVTVPIVITVRVGSDANEVLNGTAGIDMIFGRGGRNTINGGAGSDLLCGGNSNDWIFGGDGNDILAGQNGDDHLDGGNGNDTLRGNAGNDSLTGGTGADFFSGGSGIDAAVDFSSANGDTSDGTIP